MSQDYPDNIFYTVKFENQFISDAPNEGDKLAVKNDMTSIILKKQSDFKCAVHSFSLDMDIPLFIFPVKQGTNANPLLSDYGVCLSHAGSDYPAPVLYSPQSNNPVGIAPNSNQGIQDLSTLYYYVYSINHFLEMVNSALTVAYTALNAAVPATFPEAPYFIHEPEIGLISLIVPYEYFTNNAQIFMNRLLSAYFSSFYFFYAGINQANFKDYQIIVSNYNNENAYALKGASIPVPPATPSYLKIKSEYDTRYRWNNIRSLVFTSDSIKTRNEYLPQTTNLNAFQLTNSAFNPNFQNVLSYFDIISESSGTRIPWTEIQYYQPHIYKWIDLVSDEVLNRIQVNIFYELQTGELVPVRIPPTTTSKITLLFRRI